MLNDVCFFFLKESFVCHFFFAVLFVIRQDELFFFFSLITHPAKLDFYDFCMYDDNTLHFFGKTLKRSFFVLDF